MSDAAPSGNWLPPGTRLGEFEITRLLGEGGFGVVYAAHDHSLGRTVAIKEYMPSALASRMADGQVQVKSERHLDTFQAALRSFINEARLLAQFDHPSLLKVYRFWEAHGTAYMAMPLYQGSNLKDVLRSSRDEAWLLELLDPLTAALSVMHAEQVYHRDIAPDNILLLADSGRPLLLDFGSARRVIGDMTQALTVILKPGYAPVEQYAEMPGMKQGPWTDIYALGAVMHYAIAGRVPPPSVGRMLGETYEPLAKTAPRGYSQRFLAAIDRALALRPEDRQADVASFRAELGLGEPRQTFPKLATTCAKPAPPSRPERTQIRPREDLPRTAAPASAQNDAMPGPERTQIVRAAARSAAGHLIVNASPDASLVERIVPVTAARMEIGREASGLRVQDPFCSARNAAVERTPDGFRLVDLGGSNPTVLNGRVMREGESLPLLFGANILIGKTALRFVASAMEVPDLTECEIAGRYRLEQRLRHSAKGAVYRAVAMDTGLQLAIKVLSTEITQIPDYRAQFDTEAKVARQLRHPHICELRDYGQAPVTGRSRLQEVCYLCYSLLGGGNLEDRLARNERPDQPEVRTWLRQLAGALQHAHDRGVRHGNIKPSAVAFDDGNHVYLTDFSVGQLSAGALLGAPAYLAPEQWSQDFIGPPADQFSLAVLSYELLTGSRPFAGQDDPINRERNFRRGPEDAHLEAQRRARPPVPPAVSAVLRRAMSSEPTARFESVGAFAAALETAFSAGASPSPVPPVFISYQREKSAGWATLIEWVLDEKHGIRCFLDSQGSDRAQEFPQKVADAVRGCTVFVCLIDSTTLNAPWVREEIRLAHEAGRPMIPVFQEGFRRKAPLPDDPAVHALMRHDALELFDKRNVHVRYTIADLAKRIRHTIGER